MANIYGSHKSKYWPRSTSGGGTAPQKSLNVQVPSAAVEISDQQKAILAMLSILAISKVTEKLDIVAPPRDFVQRKNISKNQTESFIQQIGIRIDFSAYIAAGTPYNEISSVAKRIKANLMIVGNIVRIGIKELIIENTAEKILSRPSG